MKLTQFLTTGKHPTSQRETSALLDWCRSKILTLSPRKPCELTNRTNSTLTAASRNPNPNPASKMQTNPFTVFGMSLEQGIAIAERAPKGKLLETLAAAHLADERARESAKSPTPQSKSMLLKQSDYHAQVAKLEAELKALGGTPSKEKHRKGDKPGFTQHNYQNHIKELEGLIAQRKAGRQAAAAPARPASTAPAAPTSTLSAQSLAAALLDEQDRRAAAAKIKTREQFTAMSPREQSAFCRGGGRIV